MRCPSFYGSYADGHKLHWVDGRWGNKFTRAINWWYHNGPVGNFFRHLQNVLQGHHWLRNKLPNPYQGGTRWNWHWVPRTCSFCGSIHPTDAAQLITEGWKITGTDKCYKEYLEPPTGPSPIPPVKYYYGHQP